MAGVWPAATDLLAAVPPWVLVVLSALGGGLAGLLLLLLRGDRTPAAEDAPPGLAVLEFRGQGLEAANRAGAAFLAGLPGTDPPAPRFRAWLARHAPALAPRLDDLEAGGRAFSGLLEDGEGRAWRIEGRTHGALARLELGAADETGRALLAAERRAAELEAESGRLRALVEGAPVPLWLAAPGGGVSWANPAARRALPGGSAPAALHLVPPAGSEGGFRRAVPGPDGLTHWFDVSEWPAGPGAVAGAALPADEVIRAEAALKRFVETLTETFAHLPIGLAVFDRNRRLGLFNPAISAILRLDPAWLATRPSLRDFLERLRENRQMPDQRDFPAWRRKLTALERDAEEAAYEEDWVLPSGQTLRVIGRPHPQGAIAFLFEDISATVMLERRYRSEIETLRAVLHKMPEAILLLGPDGTLLDANASFQSLWGFDPRLGEAAPHVSRLIERLAPLCEPTTLWRELRDFATGQEARAAWTDRLLLADGRILRARVAPLPDGSTFASFGDVTEREEAAADLHVRIALVEAERDRLRAGAAEIAARLEAALARGGPQDPGAGAEAGAAADLAADLGERLRRLAAAPPPREGDPPGPADPALCLRAVLSALAEAAEARALVLLAEPGAPPPVPDMPARRLRQILYNLAAEAVATAPQGSTIRFSLESDGAALMATAVSAHPSGQRETGPGFAGALLRRLVQLEGGELVAARDEAGTRRLLTCRLPLRRARDGAEAAARRATAG